MTLNLDALNNIITSINDALWAYLLIGALILCGLYFTIRSRFVQFTMLGDMFRQLVDSSSTHSGKKKHISSFQAFAVSMATRVGTGNLAGVATAIAVGGPGAVFWMWLIALFGSATAFVEATLAQLFKRPSSESFIGGPAYYIRHGMHNKWMAGLFAVLITLTFGLSYNSIQSNAICGALNKAFGFDPLVVGCIITAIALFIAFGGIQRIARVSSILVPIMAIGYFVLALFVVITNINMIPHVFKLIIESAFGFEQVAGGGLGMTIMVGVKRGLFSNEAGEGSAPNVAATADISHPVKQGLIQALGVFTDTLLVCSCTAFMVLVSGLYTIEGLEGIQLTQASLESQVGSWGTIFVAISLFLFAFSSIIGNYYYGEANIRFLTDKKWVLTVFRILSGGGFVFLGAVASFEFVWNMGDLFMALVTLCNLIALAFLSKYAFKLLKNYRDQRRRGIENPVFHRSDLPEVANDLEAWD
ncbi:MAG: alanine:cation symporter family protein [Muribaculaceae bacterium]|nr:alanine:cation symporter family protein [Muribaculaceae bacterium]